MKWGPAVKCLPIYIPRVLEECSVFGSHKNNAAHLAHHLRKWTLLFPWSTTKPNGVKARKAGFPDTSWKTISKQNTLKHNLNRNQTWCFTEWLAIQKKKKKTAVLEKPCMDADQHHMFPASGLSAGNFALMFQVSVHWGRATTHRTSVSVHQKHQQCNRKKVLEGKTLQREAQTN